MITMLIVDDQPCVLDAMRQCIALEPDLSIIGEAEDGATALSLARELHPDIMVTDIKMPHMDGIAMATALRDTAPDIKVVVLTVHDNKSLKSQAHEAGVAAYICKHEPAEYILASIRKVAGEMEVRS